MKRGWIIASLVFLAGFGFFIWMSVRLPLIDELGPGPGFFPIGLAALGGALSILLVLEQMRAPADAPGESIVPDRAAFFRLLSVVLMLAAAAALLDWLGWRITALLVTGLLLPALGARSPLVIASFALVASLGVFHVFYHWLKVPLPIGAFGI